MSTGTSCPDRSQFNGISAPFSMSLATDVSGQMVRPMPFFRQAFRLLMLETSTILGRMFRFSSDRSKDFL